jgi:hypothetical protein
MHRRPTCMCSHALLVCPHPAADYPGPAHPAASPSSSQAALPYEPLRVHTVGIHEATFDLQHPEFDTCARLLIIFAKWPRNYQVLGPAARVYRCGWLCPSAGCGLEAACCKAGLPILTPRSLPPVRRSWASQSLACERCSWTAPCLIQPASCGPRREVRGSPASPSWPGGRRAGMREWVSRPL